MAGKWGEVLKEMAPRVERVLLVQNPANFGWPGYLRAAEAAALLLKVRLTPGKVTDAATIRLVIEEFAREPNGGLIVLPDTTTSAHRELIVTLANDHRLPAVYLPITHIRRPTFASSESTVILFVTPNHGGVPDERGCEVQRARLAG